MTGLSDKILGEIRTKNIRPTARWRFRAANWIKIVLSAAAVVAGSMAVSATFFLFVDYEWEFAAYPDKGLIVHVIQGIPYFWLAVLGAFIVAGVVDFNRIKGGYRYRSSAVVAVYLAFSLILGTLLFISGLGESLDDALESRVPIYQDLVWHKADFWTQPELGLLAGTVISVIGPDRFLIRDFSGRTWLIGSAGASWEQGTSLKDDETLKLNGVPSDGAVFQASEVRIWNSLKDQHRCIRQPGSRCP